MSFSALNHIVLGLDPERSSKVSMDAFNFRPNCQSWTHLRTTNVPKPNYLTHFPFWWHNLLLAQTNIFFLDRSGPPSSTNFSTLTETIVRLENSLRGFAPVRPRPWAVQSFNGRCPLANSTNNNMFETLKHSRRLLPRVVPFTVSGWTSKYATGLK